MSSDRTQQIVWRCLFPTYKAVSGQYIDTKAAISAEEEGAFVPTLCIDVETEKFKDFP